MPPVRENIFLKMARCALPFLFRECSCNKCHYLWDIFCYCDRSYRGNWRPKITGGIAEGEHFSIIPNPADRSATIDAILREGIDHEM